MVVSGPNINNIMSGIENTGGVKQNNKKKLRQRFDIIKKLGQGTFGKVQLGINKETGQEVAIKTIKKSKIESEADLIRIRREIQIMSSVQHPNIIHIYEVFENKEKMVLVMEYAAGGELYDYLSERKVLSEVEARRIFRQIATACYYCHKHKICHRDLKLENILLDENNNAKIADFGLSNVFDDQRLLNTFCGSPLYASPEIVKGTPYHGPEVDCWSLGVLLYTLVYGAMPFDGSNFKVLVRQISHGDYFEPATPSPASPLIREMLTVNPKNRADIEKICTHWWVNETYDDNCLDISEELANQTPVRLDVLLSLAPPPPQLESEKLVVTGDVCEEAAKLDTNAPARSQSVGSIMDLTPAEKRRIDLMNEDKVSPKRKLESTISSNTLNQDKGVTRKEKIIKDNTVADITVRGAIKEASVEDASMTEPIPLNKSLTQTLSREMDVEQTEEIVDPTMQGAACSALIEESQKKESKKQPKVKKTVSSTVNNQILEDINENPSQTVENHVDKENVKDEAKQVKEDEKTKTTTKPVVKKKIEKKKILTDKDDNSKSTSESQSVSESKKVVKPTEKKAEVEEKPEEPSKPVERRKSRTFEAAEKFQNMISNTTETKPAPVEKPKKILIPGVSVDGFKKEYERKASLTSTSPPKIKAEPPVKKIIDVDNKESDSVAKVESKPETKKTEERKEAVRNAVNIISSALDKEGTRKSKSRPCMMRKPPVPFGASGRSASGNIGMLTSQLSPPLGPKPFVKTVFDKPLPTEAKRVQAEPEPVEENKVSSAEITLKSATLPRRKTAKAEIQLTYPMPKPATMEFKTEMAHNVAVPPKNVTQRSEVVVPVSSPPIVGFRASSVDPDTKKSKERIIPIAFDKTADNRESVQSPQPKPPMNRTFQTQKSNQSQRSGSISRQSTQESDTDTVTSTGEPIKKSPREYIIPIAVEGGGYVTPRAGSLEPSEGGSTSTMSSKSRFGRTKRMNSRLSDRDSEDESPFTNLHRHSSFGKESDSEETRNPFHFHRLRSTRPKKSNLEHTDSLSSGEEDDDEGFDNFTAENLFSTLLSRVRELTQRLNVEDGVRPGFPTSRLLSQFNHGTNFFNRQDPFLRHSSLSRTFSRERPDNNSTSSFGGTPWRRSVSRDLTSDVESVFNDPNSMSSRPRGDTLKNESLNLSDLDLKKLKLSDEDALALSYLTPALSKRIQKQLLAQLAPSEAKKLHRTLSSQSSTSDNAYENAKDSPKYRRSADRLCSTLPRRFSTDRDSKISNLSNINERENMEAKNNRSFLPVKSFARERTPYHEFSVRSSSFGAEPRCDTKFLPSRKPNFGRSSSVREQRPYASRNDPSPDSSISESLSRNDDSSYKKDTDSISDLSSNTSRSYSRFSSEPYYNKVSSNRLTSNPLQSNNLDSSKTEIKKPSSTSRRISRFLRPDFYDGQKEDKDNVVVKEKKEKELETQKVLKEIRDKRKTRLNMRRERSLSKDRQVDCDTAGTPDIHAEVNKFLETKSKIDSAKNIGLISNGHSDSNTDSLSNSAQSCKKLTSQILDNINGNMEHDYVNLKDCNQNVVQTENVPPPNHIPDYVNVVDSNATQSPVEKIASENPQNTIHDYVNVKAPEVVLKKERISKIARPKSYPAEKPKDTPDAVVPEKEKEKESKISRLKKGFVRQSSKEKEDKSEKSQVEEEKSPKNKLLQSIEKKLEKFRSSNIAATKDPEEVKVLQDKKSSVENAIKRLREQSLPRNNEHCTESGLIKRAVSVEEMPNNKPLQASRKSVTKILGLFKKYEEQDGKKKEKLVKKSKSGDKEKRDKTNAKNIENKVDNKEVKQPNESVIVTNSNTSTSVNSNSTDNNNSVVNGTDSSLSEDLNSNLEKKERPRSLVFEKNKHFQTPYNGARSDTAFTNDKGKSKLPVNNFRRSLNLDNLPEPPKFYRNPTIKMSNDSENNNLDRPTRENLKLDFSKLPGHSQSAAVLDSYHSSASSDLYRNHYRDKRNSLNTPDDSSAFLSPGDDNASCDSWSVCSDLHTHELHSPLSPNGHIYSGDEGESVIDRIRRKSFYTRFNEKKRPRIPSFTRNYKDLDVYNKESSIKSPTDYSSLDRRNFRNPVTRRSSYASSIQDPIKPEYKTYQRSSSLLNDYVNVPNRYQTYSSKIGRPTTSLYSDSEDNTLDDYLSTAKSRKYSSQLQPSRLSRASPSSRYSTERTPASITSPTNSEPS